MSTFSFLWPQDGNILGWNISCLTTSRDCSSLSPSSFLPFLFSIVYSRLKKKETIVKCQVLHLNLRGKYPFLSMDWIRIWKKCRSCTKRGKYLAKGGKKNLDRLELEALDYSKELNSQFGRLLNYYLMPLSHQVL